MPWSLEIYWKPNSGKGESDLRCERRGDKIRFYVTLPKSSTGVNKKLTVTNELQATLIKRRPNPNAPVLLKIYSGGKFEKNSLRNEILLECRESSKKCHVRLLECKVSNITSLHISCNDLTLDRTFNTEANLSIYAEETIRVQKSIRSPAVSFRSENGNVVVASEVILRTDVFESSANMTTIDGAVSCSERDFSEASLKKPKYTAASDETESKTSENITPLFKTENQTSKIIVPLEKTEGQTSENIALLDKTEKEASKQSSPEEEIKGQSAKNTTPSDKSEGQISKNTKSINKTEEQTSKNTKLLENIEGQKSKQSTSLHKTEGKTIENTLSLDITEGGQMSDENSTPLDKIEGRQTSKECQTSENTKPLEKIEGTQTSNECQTSENPTSLDKIEEGQMSNESQTTENPTPSHKSEETTHENTTMSEANPKKAKNKTNTDKTEEQTSEITTPLIKTEAQMSGHNTPSDMTEELSSENTTLLGKTEKETSDAYHESKSHLSMTVMGNLHIGTDGKIGFEADNKSLLVDFISVTVSGDICNFGKIQASHLVSLTASNFVSVRNCKADTAQRYHDHIKEKLGIYDDIVDPEIELTPANLLVAVEKCNVIQVADLLQRGADPRSPSTSKGKTASTIASKNLVDNFFLGERYLGDSERESHDAVSSLIRSWEKRSGMVIAPTIICNLGGDLDDCAQLVGANIHFNVTGNVIVEENTIWNSGNISGRCMGNFTIKGDAKLSKFEDFCVGDIFSLEDTGKMFISIGGTVKVSNLFRNRNVLYVCKNDGTSLFHLTTNVFQQSPDGVLGSRGKLRVSIVDHSVQWEGRIEAKSLCFDIGGDCQLDGKILSQHVCAIKIVTGTQEKLGKLEILKNGSVKVINGKLIAINDKQRQSGDFDICVSGTMSAKGIYAKDINMNLLAISVTEIFPEMKHDRQTITCTVHILKTDKLSDIFFCANVKDTEIRCKMDKWTHKGNMSIDKPDHIKTKAIIEVSEMKNSGVIENLDELHFTIHKALINVRPLGANDGIILTGNGAISIDNKSTIICWGGTIEMREIGKLQVFKGSEIQAINIFISTVHGKNTNAINSEIKWDVKNSGKIRSDRNLIVEARNVINRNGELISNNTCVDITWNAPFQTEIEGIVYAPEKITFVSKHSEIFRCKCSGGKRLNNSQQKQFYVPNKGTIIECCEGVVVIATKFVADEHSCLTISSYKGCNMLETLQVPNLLFQTRQEKNLALLSETENIDFYKEDDTKTNETENVYDEEQNKEGILNIILESEDLPGNEDNNIYAVRILKDCSVETTRTTLTNAHLFKAMIKTYSNCRMNSNCIDARNCLLRLDGEFEFTGICGINSFSLDISNKSNCIMSPNQKYQEAGLQIIGTSRLSISGEIRQENLMESIPSPLHLSGSEIHINGCINTGGSLILSGEKEVCISNYSDVSCTGLFCRRDQSETTTDIFSITNSKLNVCGPVECRVKSFFMDNASMIVFSANDHFVIQSRSVTLSGRLNCSGGGNLVINCQDRLDVLNLDCKLSNVNANLISENEIDMDESSCMEIEQGKLHISTATEDNEDLIGRISLSGSIIGSNCEDPGEGKTDLVIECKDLLLAKANIARFTVVDIYVNSLAVTSESKLLNVYEMNVDATTIDLQGVFTSIKNVKIQPDNLLVRGSVSDIDQLTIEAKSTVVNCGTMQAKYTGVVAPIFLNCPSIPDADNGLLEILPTLGNTEQRKIIVEGLLCISVGSFVQGTNITVKSVLRFDFASKQSTRLPTQSELDSWKTVVNSSLLDVARNSTSDVERIVKEALEIPKVVCKFGVGSLLCKDIVELSQAIQQNGLAAFRIENLVQCLNKAHTQYSRISTLQLLKELPRKIRKLKNSAKAVATELIGKTFGPTSFSNTMDFGSSSDKEGIESQSFIFLGEKTDLKTSGNFTAQSLIFGGERGIWKNEGVLETCGDIIISAKFVEQNGRQRKLMQSLYGCIKLEAETIKAQNLRSKTLMAYATKQVDIDTAKVENETKLSSENITVHNVKTETACLHGGQRVIAESIESKENINVSGKEVVLSRTKTEDGYIQVQSETANLSNIRSQSLKVDASKTAIVKEVEVENDADVHAKSIEARDIKSRKLNLQGNESVTAEAVDSTEQTTVRGRDVTLTNAKSESGSIQVQSENANLSEIRSLDLKVNASNTVIVKKANVENDTEIYAKKIEAENIRSKTVNLQGKDNVTADALESTTGTTVKAKNVTLTNADSENGCIHVQSEIANLSQIRSQNLKVDASKNAIIKDAKVENDTKVISENIEARDVSSKTLNLQGSEHVKADSIESMELTTISAKDVTLTNAKSEEGSIQIKSDNANVRHVAAQNLNVYATKKSSIEKVDVTNDIVIQGEIIEGKDIKSGNLMASASNKVKLDDVSSRENSTIQSGGEVQIDNLSSDKVNINAKNNVKIGNVRSNTDINVCSEEGNITLDSKIECETANLDARKGNISLKGKSGNANHELQKLVMRTKKFEDLEEMLNKRGAYRDLKVAEEFDLAVEDQDVILANLNMDAGLILAARSIDVQDDIQSEKSIGLKASVGSITVRENARVKASNNVTMVAKTKLDICENASVEAGEHVYMESETSSVNITAATVKAGETIGIKAKKDINVSAKTENGPAKKSVIQAGKSSDGSASITLDSDRDINIHASSIKSDGKNKFLAKRNINVTAHAYKTSHTEKHQIRLGSWVLREDITTTTLTHVDKSDIMGEQNTFEAGGNFTSIGSNLKSEMGNTVHAKGRVSFKDIVAKDEKTTTTNVLGGALYHRNEKETSEVSFGSLVEDTSSLADTKIISDTSDVEWTGSSIKSSGRVFEKAKGKVVHQKRILNHTRSVEECGYFAGRSSKDSEDDFSLKVGYNYHNSNETFQTVSDGSLECAHYSVEAEEFQALDAFDINVDNDMTLDVRKFKFEGAHLQKSAQTYDVGLELEMTTLQVAVGFSTMTGTTHQSQNLNVGGKLSFVNVEKGTFDCSKADVGEIAGNIDKLDVISRADTMNHFQTDMTVGVDLATWIPEGEVSVGNSYSQLVNCPTNLNVRGSSHNFSVGDLYLKGSTITFDGDVHNFAKNIVTEDVQEVENSVNLSLSLKKPKKPKNMKMPSGGMSFGMNHMHGKTKSCIASRHGNVDESIKQRVNTDLNKCKVVDLEFGVGFTHEFKGKPSKNMKSIGKKIGKSVAKEIATKSIEHVGLPTDVAKVITDMTEGKLSLQNALKSVLAKAGKSSLPDDLKDILDLLLADDNTMMLVSWICAKFGIKSDLIDITMEIIQGSKNPEIVVMKLMRLAAENYGLSDDILDIADRLYKSSKQGGVLKTKMKESTLVILKSQEGQSVFRKLSDFLGIPSGFVDLMLNVLNQSNPQKVCIHLFKVFADVVGMPSSFICAAEAVLLDGNIRKAIALVVKNACKDTKIIEIIAEAFSDCKDIKIAVKTTFRKLAIHFGVPINVADGIVAIIEGRSTEGGIHSLVQHFLKDFKTIFKDTKSRKAATSLADRVLPIVENYSKLTNEFIVQIKKIRGSKCSKSDVLPLVELMLTMSGIDKEDADTTLLLSPDKVDVVADSKELLSSVCGSVGISNTVTDSLYQVLDKTSQTSTKTEQLKIFDKMMNEMLSSQISEFAHHTRIPPDVVEHLLSASCEKKQLDAVVKIICMMAGITNEHIDNFLSLIRDGDNAHFVEWVIKYTHLHPAFTKSMSKEIRASKNVREIIKTVLLCLVKDLNFSDETVGNVQILISGRLPKCGIPQLLKTLILEIATLKANEKVLLKILNTSYSDIETLPHQIDLILGVTMAESWIQKISILMRYLAPKHGMQPDILEGVIHLILEKNPDKLISWLATKHGIEEKLLKVVADAIINKKSREDILKTLAKTFDIPEQVVILIQQVIKGTNKLSKNNQMKGIIPRHKTKIPLFG